MRGHLVGVGEVVHIVIAIDSVDDKISSMVLLGPAFINEFKEELAKVCLKSKLNLRHVILI